MFSSHLDAYKIFDEMIFGNGEQYLFNFATNLYWLKFLKITNYLPNSLLVDALDGINKGMTTKVRLIKIIMMHLA